MSDGGKEIDVVEDGKKLMEGGNTQIKMFTAESSNIPLTAYHRGDVFEIFVRNLLFSVQNGKDEASSTSLSGYSCMNI